MLLVIFGASGCAALIYEMVWFHLVQLVVGASSISVAVLLCSFMGGMALGSWLIPRLAPPVAPTRCGYRHPRSRHRAARLPDTAGGCRLCSKRTSPSSVTDSARCC